MKYMHYVSILLFVSFLYTNASAQQTPVFYRSDIFFNEYTIRNVTTGDFDHDNNDDIMVGTDVGEFILFGDGSGSFSEPVIISETYLGEAFPAHLNNDGYLDIVLTNGAVLLGDGTGTFSTVLDENVIDTKQVADINNDGIQDIIFSKLEARFGNGNATFSSPHTLSDIGNPYGQTNVELAEDFNNDGFTDLIVTDIYPDSSIPFHFTDIHILFGSGESLFHESQLISTVMDMTHNNINVFDYNADNNLDIFISCIMGLDSSINIFEGDGEGNFEETWNEKFYNTAYLSFVDNINDDAVMDILSIGFNFVGNIHTDSLSVRFGQSDGIFQERLTVPFPRLFVSSADHINCTDINNDSLIDFIVFNQEPNRSISVYTQENEVTGIDEKLDTPILFHSLQNYPNPFNQATTVTYSIAEPGRVELSVYSITGQKVATLVDNTMSAGTHSTVFDGSGLGSGMYFYRFQSPGLKKTGKMLLVK